MTRNVVPAVSVKSRRPQQRSADSDQNTRAQLKLLETRSYKTYLARQSACVRLGRRARGWNWALVAFSTATTIAAVGMLTEPLMYGPNGSTLLVCLSVVSLVISLAATNMDYSGRSRDMFLNYRKIQRISIEVEELANRKDTIITVAMSRDFSNRYQSVLDETENHTSGDYFRTIPQKPKPKKENKTAKLNQENVQCGKTLPARSSTDADEFSEKHANNHKIGTFVRLRSIWMDSAITAIPYLSLVVPVGLFIPLGISLTP
ncbi:SLATT domain-containing protein [Rhodococcus sp. P1Y]|uniref:SLATT domain-containing protein n=1 Tax=Rhodococcus sp. P1Y TaxID=1302308 RepID=UPI00137ABC4E|nr:SLATT domain-containing protein [Rhodococcus sp. P1Y]